MVMSVAPTIGDNLVSFDRRTGENFDRARADNDKSQNTRGRFIVPIGQNISFPRKTINSGNGTKHYN